MELPFIREKLPPEPTLPDGTPIRCTTCGQCCKIYLPSSHGGSFPEKHVSYQDHCLNWLDKFTEAGVLEITPEGKIVPTEKVGIEPLHDPLNPESKRFPWVDPTRCQFCHPVTGCLIPREKRPPLCRSFVCWET